MDLPVSVTELGEQLREGRGIAPDPALFSDPQVFAAERERIFQRSVMALDHETRLSEDGRWFRCDAAARSILVTRERAAASMRCAICAFTPATRYARRRRVRPSG